MLNWSACLKPLAAKVGREHPGAVAAHLRQRPVGVSVVHEPRSVRCEREHLRVVRQLGGDDADDPVAADPGAPVRERPDPVGGQGQAAVEVGYQDEVVLGAVPLCEPQRPHVSHCL